jgi:Xaa-Pro aminopeptidase
MRTMHSVLKRGGLYWARDLLPAAAYEQRLKRLQAIVAGSGDEAWLLFGDVERHGNVVYATNFMPRVRSALAFVPRTGEPVLLANIGLRDVPAAKTITWVDDVRPFGRLPRELIALIEEKGLSRAPIGICGFEESLPVSDWTAIEQGLPGVRWADRGPRLRSLRASKEAWEVEAIRRAGTMADAALASAPKVLRPGVSMRQAIAAIDRHVREMGAEDARYLVASGPQTSLSLRPVDDRIVADGETIMLSMVVQAQRYWAETARTFVFGKASPALSELHRAATAALTTARQAIRAGVAIEAVVPAIEAALPDPALVKAATAYGFGHGIGLDSEELPIIRKGATESIVEDATLALRVILHGSHHGAAVAQTVLARPNACTPLNAEAALIEIT